MNAQKGEGATSIGGYFRVITKRLFSGFLKESPAQTHLPVCVSASWKGWSHTAQNENNSSPLTISEKTWVGTQMAGPGFCWDEDVKTISQALRYDRDDHISTLVRYIRY